MLIGYGIMLNEEIFNYARSLELKLFNKFGTMNGLRQEPHITIKAPFEIDSFSPFEEYFDELAKVVTSFEIQFDGIGSFSPNVIYINVANNRNLTDLHNKIIKDLSHRFKIEKNQYEGENKVFHTTISFTDNNDDLDEQLKFLSNEKPNFKFIFDTLGMFLYHGEKEGWVVMRRSKINNINLNLL